MQLPDNRPRYSAPATSRDPVPAFGERQGRVAGEMTFELELLNLSAIEATKSRRQAAERLNQYELCGDEVNDEAESSLLCKHQSMLGFLLHFA